MIKLLKILIGSLLILVGTAGLLLGIMAIADPSGAQLANDLNPFGKPPTLIENLTIIIFFILFAISGFILIKPKR
ncbi:MAG: hypothetical protein WCG83_07440 [Candidatus Peregrinibacteria bacterium]